jgi:hypothetical protein
MTMFVAMAMLVFAFRFHVVDQDHTAESKCEPEMKGLIVMQYFWLLISKIHSS